MSILGAPGIFLDDRDSRAMSNILKNCGAGHNSALRNAFPRRHRSLGSTERRHAYFIGKPPPSNSGGGLATSTLRNWEAYPHMGTLHLDSKIQQYDCYTPRRWLFGGTPKIPIGAFGNPFKHDFMNPADSPASKTHGRIL